MFVVVSLKFVEQSCSPLDVTNARTGKPRNRFFGLCNQVRDDEPVEQQTTNNSRVPAYILYNHYLLNQGIHSAAMFECYYGATFRLNDDRTKACALNQKMERPRSTIRCGLRFLFPFFFFFN